MGVYYIRHNITRTPAPTLRHLPAFFVIAGRRRGQRSVAVQFDPAFLEEVVRRRSALRAELARCLGTPRKITWEVGCGHGHFLVAQAIAHPAHFFIGVDVSSERIARARRKSERARLANCVFIQCEAREFLRELPRAFALEEIWVLFPDPWPKKRHHKNRVMQSEFLEAVAGRAGQGARIFYRTDHTGYFAATVGLFAGSQTWSLDAGALWPPELATVFQARAPSYQSLVAVRTSHPAIPTETVAPGLPPPTSPTSPA